MLEMNVNFVKEDPLPQRSVYISMAVTTPASLFTPIVKDAEGKSIQQIPTDGKELAGGVK